MDTEEILKFCVEKGLLLDREVLELFSEEGDIENVKLVIEKIKNQTQKKIITRNLFYENKDKLNLFFSSLPIERQENLKIKLGLSIEISKKIDIKNNLKEEDSKVRIISMDYCEGKKLKVGDFINYFRNRFLNMRGFLQNNSLLDNLVSIDKISNLKQGISIIGMISGKKITKNKNMILDVEDLTGRIKILINKDNKDVFEKAEDLALDSVIGFKCFGNREILFAQEIVFPEARLFERKRSPIEEYALFLGDLQYGSKKFMRENFLKFINYLNGGIGNVQETDKIKYLFIVGDLVSGVGVYPDHERDLEIVDLEDQYLRVANLLSKIRKDIKIIISPGNHDGVRLMEPQPIFDEKYAWPLYELENVVLSGNPALVNIGAMRDFSGFNVLTYHGFSYPFFADNVPKLMRIKAMNSPEKIMEYLLKLRHLAPTHGSVQYFPGNNDSHLIKEIPDIFVSGHTHKSGVSYFNNILIVSGSTWEELTPYQEKFGNIPDHCKVPMLNLKTRALKILDFE